MTELPTPFLTMGSNPEESFKSRLKKVERVSASRIKEERLFQLTIAIAKGSATIISGTLGITRRLAS